MKTPRISDDSLRMMKLLPDDQVLKLLANEIILLRSQLAAALHGLRQFSNSSRPGGYDTAGRIIKAIEEMV